jgi:hypothetical protein
MRNGKPAVITRYRARRGPDPFKGKIARKRGISREKLDLDLGVADFQIGRICGRIAGGIKNNQQENHDRQKFREHKAVSANLALLANPNWRFVRRSLLVRAPA